MKAHFTQILYFLCCGLDASAKEPRVSKSSIQVEDFHQQDSIHQNIGRDQHNASSLCAIHHGHSNLRGNLHAALELSKYVKIGQHRYLQLENLFYPEEKKEHLMENAHQKKNKRAKRKPEKDEKRSKNRAKTSKQSKKAQSKESKESDQSSSFTCTGRRRIKCSDDGLSIFVCHQQDENSFDTICVTKETAKNFLKDYPDDYCGKCKKPATTTTMPTIPKCNVFSKCTSARYNSRKRMCIFTPISCGRWRSCELSSGECMAFHGKCSEASPVDSSDLPASCDKSSMIVLDLPNGKTRTFKRVNSTTNFQGEDGDGSILHYIRGRNGILFGSLLDVSDGTITQFKADANGNQVVKVRHVSDFPPDAPPDIPDLPLIKSEEEEVDLVNSVKDDAPGLIDLHLLALWTPNAECRNSELAGGCSRTAQTTSNMQDMLNLAVDKTNAAYKSSGIKAQLVLVHSQVVNYMEKYDDTFDEAIEEVISKGGYLRDIYHADLVTIVIDDPRSKINGKARMNYPVLESSKAGMVSAVDWDAPLAMNTLAHEIGHNLGCYHDRGSANKTYPEKGHCSASDTNYGYREPSAEFRTIMANPCVGGQCDGVPKGFCLPIPFFSTPDPTVTWTKKPVGDARTDCAKQINKASVVVSEYFKPLVGLGWKQTDRIFADSPSSPLSFGHMVALYGNTAVVSDPKSNFVSVYNRPDQFSQWELGQELNGFDYKGADLIVALFSDTMFIGRVYDYTHLGFPFDIGRVYVFTYNGTSWIKTQDIEKRSIQFGASIALYEDIALIGAPKGAGSVYVFERSAGNDEWKEKAVVRAQTRLEKSFFGSAIALNKDVALIAANGRHLVYAFRYSESQGWEEEQILNEHEGDPMIGFGYWAESLALSSDSPNHWAFIGADNDESFLPFNQDPPFSYRPRKTGSVHVYRRFGDSSFNFEWVRLTKLFPANAIEGDHFGVSVAVGGDDIDDCTKEFCSHLSGRSLIKYRVNIPNGTVSFEIHYLGEAWLGFAFSKDGLLEGSEAVIGSHRADGNVPKKYILSENSAVLMPDDKQSLIDASIVFHSGLTVMKFTKVLKEAGEVEIYTGRKNKFLHAYGVDTTLGYHSSWVPFEFSTLMFASPGLGINYGERKLLVGSSHSNDFGLQSGSAYLFQKDLASSNWASATQQKLLPVSGNDGDLFGSSVAIFGETCLVGSKGSNSVYVFDSK